MRIIPVVDLMAGQVVRGIAGRREEYRPLESPLCGSSQPGEVARALVERFGFREMYVADLDAIAGHEPAWRIYDELAAHVPRLTIDAGVRDAKQAARLADFAASTAQGPRELAAIVAGLESVPSPATLAEMLAVVGHERLVFSLDLKLGQPLSDSAGWHGLDAWGIARTALAIGVRRAIVLDLARVGMHGGVGTEGLCRQLRDVDPGIEIIGGGGVRGAADLRSLAAAGCNGALVASALHDGRLSAVEVGRWLTM
jgi:phosphoribosylformimino-5-aminoimidazole carboxamide ribotide isomerase